MSQDKSRFPGYLLKKLQEKKVIPFVGAGVSMSVKKDYTNGDPKNLFPGWSELMLKASDVLKNENETSTANLVQALVQTGEPEDLLMAAERARTGLHPNRWATFLKKELDPDRSKANEDSLDLPKSIWNLGSNVVITTNFDKVLTWSCPDQSNLEHWDIENRAEMSSFLGGDYNKRAIWHLHGTISNAGNLILTPDGYSELYPEKNKEEKYKAALQTLRSTFASYCLLFIGFSFKDNKVRNQLKWLNKTFGGYAGHHFALIKQDEKSAKKELGELPVSVVTYKDHGELSSVLETLKKESTASRSDTSYKKIPSTTKKRDAYTEIIDRLKSPYRSYDVVGLSAHNMDTIYEIDAILPDYETTVKKQKTCPGGSGANTIYALGKLGRTVQIAGIVSDDEDGRKLLEDFDSCKMIKRDSLIIKENSRYQTGKTNVFTDEEGQRSIFVVPGINEKLHYYLKEDTEKFSLLKSLVKESKIFHQSSFTGKAESALGSSLIESANEDTIVSFTPGALYTKLGLDRLQNVLRRTNLLFLYEKQLDNLLETSVLDNKTDQMTLPDKLQHFFKWKTKRNFNEPLIIGVKKSVTPDLQKNPPEYLTLACGRKELEQFIPTGAIPVEPKSIKPEESTGAGDALAAGVIYGLLTQQELPQCADIGFVMASCASSNIGARSKLPDEKALEQKL